MERRVSFYSDGLKLAGLLFEPDGADSPRRPGVVLCQGRAGHKEFFWFPDIGRKLAALGIAALIWDYRGIGESEGERDRMFPLEHADDTRAALTFLENQPRVDAERLGLLGWSYGGGLVPFVAAVDRRVRCAISVAGAGDWEQQQRGTRRHWEWLSMLDRIAEDRRSRVLTGKPIPTLPGDLAAMSPAADAYRARVMKSIPNMADYKGAGNTLRSLERMIEFKPVEFVGQIRNCPLLYIGAERDTITIGDQVIAMYERTNGPKKLWMIPGIDHYGVYEEPYLGQVIAECSAWLQKYLVKSAAA